LKWLSIWKLTTTDMDELTVKHERQRKIMEEDPTLFTKAISELYFISGSHIGIDIVEGTPEQVTMESAFWGDDMDMIFLPLITSEKLTEAKRRLKAL